MACFRRSLSVDYGSCLMEDQPAYLAEDRAHRVVRSRFHRLDNPWRKIDCFLRQLMIIVWI